MKRLLDQDIKWVLNKSYSSEYDEAELKFFHTEEIAKILNFQKTHSKYTNTPLVSLKALAKHLRVAEIRVKDESKRFGLNAFKVMGGIYAIGKYLAQRLGKDIADLSFDELKSPAVKEHL